MNNMIANMVSLGVLMPLAILPRVLESTEVYICPLKLHLDELNYTIWCRGFTEHFNDGQEGLK